MGHASPWVQPPLPQFFNSIDVTAAATLLSHIPEAQKPPPSGGGSGGIGARGGRRGPSRPTRDKEKSDLFHHHHAPGTARRHRKPLVLVEGLPSGSGEF